MGVKFFIVRLIKFGFFSLVIFFVVLTAVSLGIPRQVRISKAINIEGSNAVILSVIKDTTKWPLWHPAYQQEKSAPHGLSVTPVRINDTAVVMQMQQYQRTPVISGWQIHRFATSDTATLQWYMDFKLSWYPWQKFSSLLYEKTYGLMMQKGLDNIKKVVEGDSAKF